MDIKGKVSKRIVVAVAAGLAAALFVSVFLVLFAGKETQRTVSAPDKIGILVAKKDMPAGTEVSPDDFTQVSVSPKSVSYGALVDASQVQGKQTVRDIKTGETLTASSFSQEAASPIPDGYVAVSLKVNNVSGVSGMLKDGDKVDVIGTYSAPSGRVSKAILQAIQVYHVKAKEESRENTVTLLVRLDEAQKLLLIYSEGDYTLALRSPSDKNIYPVASVSNAGMYGKAGAAVVKAPSTPGKIPREEKKPRITIVEVK